MLRTLCFVAALLAIAHALPTSIHADELQHLTDEISAAKSELQEMTKVEATEDKNMNQRVGESAQSALEEMNNAHHSSEDHAIALQQFAKAAKEEEKKAISAENEQQDLALKAIKNTDKALNELGSEEKKSLGEGDSAKKSSVEVAMEKLQHVSNVLHDGTKTMHTRERIERMVDETRNLEKQASSDASNNELGESLNPAAEAELHIQDAAIASEKKIQEAAVGSIHAVQQQAQRAIDQAAVNWTPEPGSGALDQAANGAAPEPAAAPATAAVDGGALTMLNASPSAAAAPEAAPEQNLAAIEKEELNKLLKQEHTVDSTEKTAIAEVNELVKDLA